MNVSRETSERLAQFEDLVRRWSTRINLVSRRDLDHIWPRHIADSIQIFDHAPQADTWLDLGSGGGFPGLVCAILSADNNDPTKFTLIESDARKCAFLREATRLLDLRADILTARIETVPPQQFDVVTARALAPLPQLLALSHPFCSPQTVCLFPKGAQAESELTAAQANWHILVERVPSRTDPGATILKLTDIAPRP
ncbi:MAG: 16S rRNA (guanine(527)-N(7))-methyltransferase RsmG [Pseudomonadota bacterium]